jgi:glutamate racemase
MTDSLNFNKNALSSIGFFDSGIGGLSVLKACKDLLPNEDFIYFADNLNMPYGKKGAFEIQLLTLKAVKILSALEIKALVIACNTATSAAVDLIRLLYPKLPVLGTEPALKPAYERSARKCLILATNSTLKRPRFLKLLGSFGASKFLIKEGNELAEPVENNLIKGAAGRKNILICLVRLLAEFKKEFSEQAIDGVVLGCTHYNFIKAEILQAIKYIVETDSQNIFKPQNLRFFDGLDGIAQNLKNRLSAENLLNKRHERGSLKLLLTKDSEKQKYKEIIKSLNLNLKEK